MTDPKKAIAIWREHAENWALDSGQIRLEVATLFGPISTVCILGSFDAIMWEKKKKC